MEVSPGEDIRDACERAVKLCTENNSNVRFTFNGCTLTAKPGSLAVDLHSRFNKKFKLGPPKTKKEQKEQLLKEMKDFDEKIEKEIKQSGALNESQMREAKVPKFATLDELSAYIKGLVDRPHDYGTCVYAMSMAAVSAFNFVASKLGVTGFQASVADLDILRQTRGLEFGKVLNFYDLLYPQNCNEERFPSLHSLFENQEVMSKLASKAKTMLEVNDASPAVKEHWRSIIAKDVHLSFGGNKCQQQSTK